MYVISLCIDMPNIWDDQLEDQNNIRYVSDTKIVSYDLILFDVLLNLFVLSGISSYSAAYTHGLFYDT